MDKKRIFCIFFVLIGILISAQAESKWDHKADSLGQVWHSELRIGWGDQLFESLMWHNPTAIVTTMPTSWKKTYHENHRHHQHLWLEYQWRFTDWFSLGGMVDFSEVGWDVVTRNGKGKELSRLNDQYFYNVVLMPTMRFTYFHHPNVNLYSSLGLGIDINGGTERNAKGELTDVGGALYATVLGMSVNYQRWFMAVDLGGMTALKDKNTIFMAASRMINVSIGARF